MFVEMKVTSPGQAVSSGRAICFLQYLWAVPQGANYLGSSPEYKSEKVKLCALWITIPPNHVIHFKTK